MTKVEQNFLKSKRRLASFEGTKLDLKNELPLLFDAFHKAVIDYEREVVLTPKQARARGLEASLLNSKVLFRVQQNFPDNWKFGKYKRFVLRINGYNILIKKLTSSNMPMNVKTINSEAINNQLTLPLFDAYDVAEPILYFGYKKDRWGNIMDPKLVYIDENFVKWTMTESQLQIAPERIIGPKYSESAEVKLRENARRKDASGF